MRRGISRSRFHSSALVIWLRLLQYPESSCQVPGDAHEVSHQPRPRVTIDRRWSPSSSLEQGGARHDQQLQVIAGGLDYMFFVGAVVDRA